MDSESYLSNENELRRFSFFLF